MCVCVCVCVWSNLCLLLLSLLAHSFKAPFFIKLNAQILFMFYLNPKNIALKFYVWQLTGFVSLWRLLQRTMTMQSGVTKLLRVIMDTSEKHRRQMYCNMCYVNKRVGVGALMIQLPSTFGFLTSFSLFLFRLIAPWPRRPGLTWRATDGYQVFCRLRDWSAFFFTAVLRKVQGYLDVAPCWLAHSYRRSQEQWILHGLLDPEY